MPHRDSLVSPLGMRRAFDRTLLCGVSLLALSVAGGFGHARSLTPGASTVVPTAAAQQAAILAAQQAAGAATQAQTSLARAAAALAAARKLQSDAAAAAQAAASSVPNGLTPGGLMPFGGTAGDPLAGIKADASKWLGANLPKQTTSGSKVSVDIQQTQKKSILYWDTFNVGANTTVNFRQSASDWIALNRVQDPSASPSRILGQINAIGGVYLINRNGIIFGAGSQVNVHTLIASSLDVGKLGSDLAARDQFFLNNGIADLNSFSIYDKDGGAATKLIAGDIKVERGASITGNILSDQVSLGSPGSVYLFGANVYNSGSITAQGGEVAMVAARTIDVVPNGYSALPDSVLGKDDKGNTIKFRGTEFRLSQFASSYYDVAGDPFKPFGYPTGAAGTYLAGTGAVKHDGVIDASRGIVVMNGDTVAIGNPTDASGHALADSAGKLIQGVISVDTSIDRNSFVLLRAATSVTMNGVISSLPVDDGAAGLASTQSFAPAYIEMSAQTNVTVGSNGLIAAPSAQVSLNAKLFPTGDVPNLFQQGRVGTSGGNEGGVLSNSNAAQSVLLSPGATVDVAGLQNVELPASYNIISFQPRAEFADMPLQRNGALYGQTMYIDIRNTGTRSDGTTWVGTPLADASGYVAKVPRSIYQLMTVGGSVSLATDLSTSNGAASVKTDGSIMNVAGGSVKFLPGMVNPTRLIGSDGRIYSMTNADPNMTYLGIAGQFIVKHARWGVTETWSTPTQIYSAGFTEGHDAGRVSVVTVNPALLGTMYFGSTAGERQISGGQLPLQGSLELTTPSSVQIGATASANYTTQSTYTTNLSADILSGYGLSSLKVKANDFVLSGGSTLNLAAGGSLSVTAGGAIDIAGSVSAAGGSVSLLTDRDSVSSNFTTLFKAPKDSSGKSIAANVFVEGTIDVSGRFVNDTGRTAGVDATGPAFINGGSISIATGKSSQSEGTAGIRDTTGSILLAAGSILDVSSGGYVSSQGKAKTVATGLMAGKGGNISLAIYQGAAWVGPNTAGQERPSPVAGNPIAVLQLDGALRGYGFESNGSLRLAGADTIRIGGKLQDGETSSIRINGSATTLPESLLTGGGFGSYIIESVKDDWSPKDDGSVVDSQIIVSAGTSLTFQQKNLSSLADYTAMSTGTKLGQQAAPQLALLPDNQRKAVDLTLKADKIKLDTGSKIVTDPKAKITMAAVTDDRRGVTLTDPKLNLSNPGTPDWNVQAKSVELLGTIVDHGGSIFINSLATHLSSDAKIDLSGTFVANSLFGTVNGPRTSGSYIAGGTFAVEGGAIITVNTYTDPTDTNKNKFYFAYGAPGSAGTPQQSDLVADAGAVVDVSGAAGNIQVAGARGATTSQWSWSDAGTVSADVSGFSWGGSFAAAGGRYVAGDGTVHADARANGGTILLGGGNIFLQQGAAGVISAPTTLTVSADQLAPFDNVYLYAAAAVGGAARIFTDLPGTTYGDSDPSWKALTISSSLNWTVTNRLHIAAGDINAPGSGSIDARIAAPYVVLTGFSSNKPVAGTSTLTVNAQTIDLESGRPSNFKPGDAQPGLDFSGFSQINLIASGDLRLGTLKVVNGLKTNGNDTSATAEQSSFTGKLVSAGDLLLSAQRIYPVSAVNFTIETPGNVKFAAPANSYTGIPLSAGGGITVYAGTIEQAGNLFAPLGKIALGNTDSAVSKIITQSVVLEPGSLTSVSLADTTVPYGATSDGTNWYYNANLNPLAQPPSKGLILAGSNVTRADGSTIDLRGGGDIQAMEWIAGKGGSRDSLTTTPSGQTVYALLPSQTDPIAAYDIHFATARSADAGKTVTAGDAIPLAGTQITIDGGNGIPAGTYTLYPAHYATLPGAMRVVVYSSDNTGKNIATGTKLPDGTVLVTGHYTQSTAPGKQSSGQTVFAVQTSSVWQQYSEYSFNGANAYYAQLAAKNNVTAPRLPMDAGRLSISALQSIVMNGVARTLPGQDKNGNTGRGSELDISAPKLAVVGHAGYVNNDIPAGYVGLDVAQLNDFESILIGGSRSDFATGTLITPTASNVVVDTRGETFSAPEILLVAQQVGQWQEVTQSVTVGSQSVLLDLPVYVPEAGSGTVTINTGSIIKTTGVVHAGLGRHYVVAADGQAPVTAQSLAAALGGTLSGTEIVGADLAKLLDPTSPARLALGYYVNGGAQQPGRGALFVASNDPTLQLTGPTATGVSAPALTIKFKDVATATAVLPAGPVTGSLTLAGGDTSNSGKVAIADGVKISTNTLTLQATASNNAIALNTTDLHANLVNLIAPSIGVGAATAVAGKSLVLPANSTQFADVQTLALRALSGPVTVYGDFNSGARSLSLDATGIALGSEVLNPGTSLNLRAGTVLAFSSSATVQFSVGVTVTSAAGVATAYAANTQIALDPNSKVSVASAGTMTVAAGSGGATLTRDGLISASNNITLKNTGASPPVSAPAANGNSLELAAKEIDLGSGRVNGNVVNGNFTIAGFSSVKWSADDSVVVKGPGTMTLGANGDKTDLTVSTPRILVAGATAGTPQGFVLTASGDISIVDPVTRGSAATAPADSDETGGILTVTASNIAVGSTIQAQAGTITLGAIAGNVTLNPGAYISARGYKKTLVDVDTYLSGGKVVLYADIGSNATGGGQVITDASSTIDVATTSGGQGYGGTIEVDALRGGAMLAGRLLGTGGPGLGGRFKLDTGGAADLTALADILLAGGLTGAIDIHTRTGNLELAAGHTLKANNITLTADDPTWIPIFQERQLGQVIIRGTLDATGYGGSTIDGTGQAGGKVALYGANSVFLASSGVIDASTTHADERGGDVTIGIGWDAKSKIWLQQGTQINVSGGTRGGLSGGTVTFRAPLDGNNDVKIAAISNVANPSGTHGMNFYADGDKTFDALPVIDATNNINDRSKVSIVGARSVAVNGFIAFDTTAGRYGIDGSSLGWFGTIDPAGWYKGVDQNGNLIPATDGTWTNVTGFQLDKTISGGTGLPSVPTSVAVKNSAGIQIATINVSGGIDTFLPNTTTLSQYFGQSDIPIIFPPPATPGGRTAQGRVSFSASGDATVTITDAGTGYLTRVTSVQIGNVTDVPAATGLFGRVLSTVKIVSASLSLAPGSTGYDGTSLSVSLGVSGNNGQATATFTKVSNMSGSTSLVNGSLQFVPTTNDYIPLTSSGVYAAFDPANQGKPGVASFTGGAGTGNAFFGDTVSQITKGTWSYNGQSYGFTNLFTRLAPLVNSLGADVVHVQPGVDLVNSKGDITVSSNWNLAAGTVGNLATDGGVTYFDPASSYVNFTYRLATPWGGLDAGVLSLRAAGNINVNASISDGFFQFANYLDKGYTDKLANYATSRSVDLGSIYLNDYTTGQLPIAPYKIGDSGNGISPTSQDLASADLFPHTLLVCTVDCSQANIKTVTAPSSWAYILTAGSDVSSANPTGRVPLANGRGDVIVDKHGSYGQFLKDGTTKVDVSIPTMIRTGTGNITISAAQDVIMRDVAAPGVIYAAGVNTATYANPYSLQASGVVVTNPDGFFEPRVLGYGNAAFAAGATELYYGPPTAAAFPEKGGDVVIDAQRDVVGGTKVVAIKDANGNTVYKKVPQYYQPWLLSSSGVTPSAGASILGAGVFAPVGTQIASQTAWWIQYGSFQQGFLSAGGNVSVLAGRNMLDVSVSAPTTGRVTGGLSANSTPVTHLYGGGNMVVRAGGDIRGGSFYEGSGHASIVAGGDIGQNDYVYRYANSTLKLPNLPLLAVDTGQITMTANGSIAMAGVVNPAALHAQQPSKANPLEPKPDPTLPLYFDAYGSASKVRLVAQSGDVTIAIAPTAISINPANSLNVQAAPATYPASFEAIALQGNLITTGISNILNQNASGASAAVPAPGIVLSPSEHGTFNLLAQGSIDLTFGYPQTSTSQSISRPLISAGPSLIDAAFDPFRPNSGNDESSSRAILAHENDVADGLDTTARIYAATGDIKATGSYGKRTTSSTENVYQRIEINRPTSIYAGRDIVDLNVIVQNIHASDVSTIAAGRNITYTGFQNGGGLQVAGPGFLVVQAGGDIGPFLPAAFDNATQAPVQEGIVSVGNSSPTPVGNTYISNSTGGGSVGIYNQSLLGPSNNPRRNAVLTDVAGTKQGADIITMFGVKYGIDYASVTDAYVIGGKAANTALPFSMAALRDIITGALPGYLKKDSIAAYLSTPQGQDALSSYLNSSTGKTALAQLNLKDLFQDGTANVIDRTKLDSFTDVLAKNGLDAVWSFFRTVLPSQIQASFFDVSTTSQPLMSVRLDQLFFAELKAVGIGQKDGTSSDTQRGYRMIETMFPARLGYTANVLGSGSNGASQLVKTGDMNLLHATVQTQLGGDISMFGPGGNIIVGSLAAEPNSALKLRDIGILTLGGGAINTFTDQSVLVNSSRVLTTQGGDILMWSSNGNLDAGRGSKTTLSAPALQVLYDQDDYQSIDLGGFVTGAGIGTLQASSQAAASQLYLLAPRGTIDFGTAGVRASGSAVFVAPVIANASNFQVQGSTTGIPTVSVPNIGALTAGSNTAGAAAKSAETPTATGARRQGSIFIVEVIGYGGGDGQDDQATDKKESDTTPSGNDKQ
ncbi:filamentous hemagglutinin family protein [Bradyrhizobium elkanii]|uniref:filamentous haemagglutinin family protein n=1 Tax=Bradyrhizobium TaxID=374 RepID=UPI002169001A|nr:MULTISPECIES: filamentous haemagglutinin family protein [Bradyrhizobium]MCS3931638.1 filamentous hemagglutinin family protein [Bradyrhizobium elkanii]MCS3972196.1 filamentous hemagglutinin family protein [Bradyrhizobium japonicum]